jgi:PAS domain S-box-containing protein
MKDRIHTIPAVLTMFVLLMLFCLSPLSVSARTVPSASVSAALNLTPAEKTWLDNHPIIWVGVMHDWPPMNFVDSNGTVQGVGADYLKALNRLLGGALVPMPGPFKENADRVQNSRLDALMDITFRPERESLFEFTRPYITIPHLLVGHKNGPNYHKEEDLAGKTVALERGFYNVNHFRKNFPAVKVREYATTSEALQAVAQGEADAYAGNRAVAAHLIEKNLLTNLTLMGTLVSPRSELQIGVRKGQKELASILDKAIAAIPATERAAIANRWITTLPERKLDYRQILLIAVLFCGTVIALLTVLVIISRRLNKRLQHQQEYWQTIFEHDGSGHLIVSADRTMLQVNQQFCNLFGYSEAELIGQSARILHLDQQHYEDWAPRFTQVRDGKTHLSAEYPWRRKDGSPFWCVFTGMSLVLPKGQSGVIWSVIETTERKQAEISLRRLSLAVEQSGNIVVITDPQGIIQYVNPRFCEVTGYSSEEAIGQNPRVLKSGYHPPELYASLWRTITSGQTWRGELHNKRKSGDLFWEQATITPLFDDNGQIINFVAIKEDITERKKTDIALQESKDRAEAANRAKTEFLANMSHEIRTPMNGIISMAHLLRMSELNEEQREYLVSMDHSAKNLLALINDILDISKIEAGKFELEYAEFSIRLTVEEIVASQKTRIVQKQLELITDLPDDLPERLEGDPLRFKQILLNLLGNAIKFTGQGSISIAVRPVSRSGATVTLCIVITDTGIGMAPEVLERIFIPFEQADSSTTRKYGGTGLGLSICRRLVELMGGRIWAESQLGYGSSFFVELAFMSPATPSVPVQEPALPKPETIHLQPLKILLAEDNRVNALSMTAILTRMGHQLVTVDDGQQAFEQWHTTGFDCILMDVQMPVMDGVEATRLIRQQEQASDRHVPIIALTAHAMRGDRERLLAEGFDGYVAKPVDFGLLCGEIMRITQKEPS